MNLNEVESLLTSMIEHEQTNLLKTARRIVPTLTPEDLLQPNDYEELENHPHFRYDEGHIAGLFSALIALRSQWKQ